MKNQSVHHSIGNTTLNYLSDKGRHLTSLTLFCHELLTTHVTVISKYCYKLNKLFLHCNEFIKNEEFNHSKNRLENLKVFVYDAPRRNRNLPVIPMSTDIAFHLIEECPSLNTIGNLISWQVAEWEVSELKQKVRSRNFDVNVICSSINKINPKYF
ncbi:hypothetical protein Anas_09628 [Armadillidium nasatum]|uniref:Uncharacterized protein n=1 Tax=Armadillidium nasatum TaxID=96803 RepID=A0A5N5T827_9CRUS|nr:hypothetical protein Anas_09628 [Armadillidium nasatum]